MQLLHWCTVRPRGSASLAAIRFSAPLRIQLIRIFAKNDRPFEQSPSVVAETEPGSFFLEVFLNAHSIQSSSQPPESKEKSRPLNALVPTTLAYIGGTMDFPFDMGPEFATRLMILKGAFEVLTIAMYGILVSPPQEPAEVSSLLASAFTPRSLPDTSPLALSPVLDPSSTTDPTRLAKSLLALIPDAPPLCLVIRLMFCLKAPSHDWDLKEFPYVFADLDALVESGSTTEQGDGETEAEGVVLLDDEDDQSGSGENKLQASSNVEPYLGLGFLERATSVTTRPVSDDINHDILDRFARRVSSAAQNALELSPEIARQVALLVAKILCNSVSQHPDMAYTLSQHVQFGLLFNPLTLDESVLRKLLTAAIHADIANALVTANLPAILRMMTSSPSHYIKEATTDRITASNSPSITPASPVTPSTVSPLLDGFVSTSPSYNQSKLSPAVLSALTTITPEEKRLARQLLALLTAASLLGDAFSNTQGQFVHCMRVLRTVIGKEEAWVGAWVEGMIWTSERGESILGAKLKENPVIPGIQASAWGKVLNTLDEEKDTCGELCLADDGDEMLFALSLGSTHQVSHSEYISFLRCYIGITCVLAVWAWADSVGNDACREKALGIIRVWQSVEGLREITNHLLLLRQLTMRLEWIITDNDPPRKSGVLAEQALLCLTKQPKAFGRDLVRSVLQLRPPPLLEVSKHVQQRSPAMQRGDATEEQMPIDDGGYDDEQLELDEAGDGQEEQEPQRLAYISSQTVLSIRKLALVADDGLPAALEELRYFSHEHEQSTAKLLYKDTTPQARRPLSLRRLRTLRLALGIVTEKVRHLPLSRESRSKHPSNGTGNSVPRVDDPEVYQAFYALWKEHAHGVVSQLADLAEGVAEDLANHLMLSESIRRLIPALPLYSHHTDHDSSSPPSFHTVPPASNPSVIEQLFLTAHEVLQLVLRLIYPYPSPDSAFALTTRAMRSLVGAAGVVYVCGDLADMTWSFSSGFGSTSGASTLPDNRYEEGLGVGPGITSAAASARQLCVNILRPLCAQGASTISRKDGALIVLSSLLNLGCEFGKGWRGLDPVLGVTQVFYLIDAIIPHGQDDSSHEDGAEKQRIHWATSVIPLVLPQLQAYFRMLDVGNQVHLMKRLVSLDRGMVGIGEWLLVEELKLASKNIQSVRPGTKQETSPVGLGKFEIVKLHHVYLTLKLVLDLISNPSSTWALDWLTGQGITDVMNAFKDLLIAITQDYLASPILTQLMHALVAHEQMTDQNLIFHLALLQLRDAQSNGTLTWNCSPFLDVLKSIPPSFLDMVLLRWEIGRTFAAFATPESTLEKLKLETAESILTMIEWIVEQKNSTLSSLAGISEVPYNRLCDRMYQMLPYSRSDVLEGLRSSIAVVDSDEPLYPIVHLPSKLELSLQDIQDLLHPQEQDQPPVPLTPKRNTPDLLAPVISPPSALLRSPAATGLTKTYLNNDFRQLRQIPSARQNTSRLPSMHVDEFETSPSLEPVALPESQQSMN